MHPIVRAFIRPISCKPRARAAAESFPPLGEKPAPNVRGPPGSIQQFGGLTVLRTVRSARLLLLQSADNHVFRPAVLLILLTVTLGHTGGLLCNVWCDPHLGTAAGCRHEQPATFHGVTGTIVCHDVAVRMTPVAREGVRRGLPAPTPHAIVASRLPLALAIIRIRWGRGSGRVWS